MDGLTLATLQNYPANNFPAQFNGWAGVVSVANPQQYVDKANKLVIGLNTFPISEYSIAYAIFAAQGFPAVATAVTLEHITSAKPRIATILTIISILEMLANSSDANGNQAMYEIRATDVIPSAAFTAEPASGNCITAARQLREWLTDEPGRLDRYCVDSRLVLLCLVVCALHRQMDNGHNWRTDLMAVKSSVPNKVLAAAAGDRGKLAEFMSVAGHDTWHFLTDRSMYEIVDAICALNVHTVTAAHLYGNRNVVNERVDALLDVGEAARDRYPVGMLGASAMILGLELIQTMLDTLTAKIAIENCSVVVTGVTEVADRVRNKQNPLPRATLLHLKTALSPAIALAAGFCNATPAMAEMIASHPSLVRLTEKQVAGYGKGVQLQVMFKTMEADPSAYVGHLKSLVNAIKDGMISSARAANLVGTAGRLAVDIEVVIPKTPAQKRDLAAALASAVEIAQSNVTMEEVKALMEDATA